MKLSRLEIYGFKSFARKLDLKLLGGITALVGPNGCGKTNVVDAIRWVLGEQKPTQIRLDRMEDVLFKGSGSRRQLGMSEVSLTIENTSGILPVDLPEITITRRLFRSGESEYLINRKTCRLADINDIFMDTGMGSDSYSVFEQEMINAILSDKTEDRRHVFEEAAGITKYKSRRKAALNTLMSIDGDLNRLGDIITELERRVGFLKRQASRASRYRKLKSELKSKTIALGSYEIKIQKKRIVSVSLALASVKSSMEITKAKSSNIVSEIENLSVEITTIEKEIAEIAGHYEANVRAMSEKENETARLESRLESLEEMAIRARESAKRNSIVLEKMAENHGKCAKELTDVEKRLQVIDSNYSIKAEKFENCEKKVFERSDGQKSLEKSYYAIENEISSGTSTLRNLKTRREDGEKRLLEISRRIEEFSESLISINEEYVECQKQKLLLAQNKNDFSAELSVMKKKLAELMKELEIQNYELLQARNQQVSLKAEVDFLTEIIRSYRGYSEGVRSVVNSEELQERVHGVLADFISTEDRYLPAIEIALFNSLQNIVVDSPEAALEGVKYLSAGARGRAVFHPLNADFNDVPCDIPKEAGVIGPAYKFVMTDNRFMPVLRHYLDHIVIVDTLETAFKLHNRYGNFTFVTLSGEMVGLHGDIHGGCEKDNKVESSIGRHEKLKKLTTELSRADNRVDDLEKKRAKLSQDCSLLRSSIEEHEEKIEAVGLNLAEISSNEASILAKREAAADIMNNLNEESSKIKKSLKEFDIKEKELEDQISKSKIVFSDMENKLGEISREIKDLKIEHDNLRSEMNSYEIERAAMREKKAALSREIEEINNRRESLAHSSKYTIQEIDDAEAESLQVGEKNKNIREELEIFKKEYDRLEKRKVDSEKRYSELRLFRNDKEKELQNLREELVELTRKESSLTLDKDEASMIMSNIIERLSEEYFLSAEEIPSADLDNETDFDPENEKLILSDLRKKIHTIGDINLAAEADYNEEKKRLDYLNNERRDLVDARDALMETISKINQIAKARFLDTFEQTKLNFQKTFCDFFDGGICDLGMAEGEDPLEASILITARPPGKNVRSINLLSSGERALTAISLLFAIYMVKPSPFCILDEVDAPLDDANIDRFLHVIKEFSRKIQFIIVTHNKKTMAQANNLYGITMEEPGLSGLVSVRLSEVDSYDDQKSSVLNEQPDSETLKV
ncbi:chromosome segregation protein SMC [Candidatus Latescibacterota bacterium]